MRKTGALLFALLVMIGSSLIIGSGSAGATELRKASVKKVNSSCKKSQRGKTARDKKKRKLVCKKVGKKYRWKLRSTTPGGVPVRYRYVDTTMSCSNSMRLMVIGTDNVARVERVLRKAPGNTQIYPVSYRNGRLMYGVFNCSSNTNQLFLMRSLSDSAPVTLTEASADSLEGALSPDGWHAFIARRGSSTYTISDLDWSSGGSNLYASFSASGRSVDGLAAGTGDVVYVQFEAWSGGTMTVQSFNRGWSSGSTVLSLAGSGGFTQGFASNSSEALAQTNSSTLNVRLPFYAGSTPQSIPACSSGYTKDGKYIAWVADTVAMVTCSRGGVSRRNELVSFTGGSNSRSAISGGMDGINPLGLS